MFLQSYVGIKIVPEIISQLNDFGWQELVPFKLHDVTNNQLFKL